MPKKRPGASAAVVYGITQEELVVYRISDQSAKAHAKQRDNLRDSLMSRLAVGATVEPGDLTPMIITAERLGYTVEAGQTRSFKVLDTATLVPPVTL